MKTPFAFPLESANTLAGTKIQIFLLYFETIFFLPLAHMLLASGSLKSNILPYLLSMNILDFNDPTEKFFLNHPKKSHWNIELNNLVGGFFQVTPLKCSLFYSINN